MKKPAFNLLKLWLFLVLPLAPLTLQAAEKPSAAAPVAVMPETVFKFPDTMDGNYLEHDFIIQNQGNAVLNVLRVKTT
jgi:hypothetical protein